MVEFGGEEMAVLFRKRSAAAHAGQWERSRGDRRYRQCRALGAPRWGGSGKYIGLMTGLRPRIVAVVPREGPAILVGGAALFAEPSLVASLRRAAKQDPFVQADAILIRRSGERLYVAGSNDESQYFAAAWLLQHWGCRWYMTSALGEHVPPPAQA